MTTTEAAFAPVTLHLGDKSQVVDNEAVYTALKGAGWAEKSITPQSTAQRQQNVQAWTTDATRPKAIATRQNENRRTVPADVQENQSFAAKVLRYKVVNEGTPNEYADTQVEYNGKKTCIAYQDFHALNAEITITAIPRADGSGLRWNSSN